MRLNRRKWKVVRGFTIGWIVAFVFMSIIRGSGTIEEGSAQFDLSVAIAISVLLGSIFGSVAGFVQVWMEDRTYKRMSLGRLLVTRLLVSLSSLVGLVLFAYVVVSTFFGVSIGLWEFAFEPGSLAIYFYILCVDLFLVMLRQVNLLLGEGTLWQLLRGRFYTPREEERIFMFLDLVSSTTLAERLGHIKYSMLIQDCFDDLGVVSEYGAQIYQYVGDGVVLTWPMADGLRDASCVRAYFAFRQRLSGRASYYEEQYHAMPRFRAGMNAGSVIVTEVGRHKKEIAYHGDTLNTAARIQGKCKEFEVDFLMAEPLREQLPSSEFIFASLGSAELRGKEASVAIVAVEHNDALRVDARD